MRLSNRLLAVADLVTGGGTLADIGPDHGYIPVSLVSQGKIKKAVAMDVNAGPLERAAQHIKEAGLNEYITLRRSDGLHRLEEHEADSIVIAGMGGGLIRRILTEGVDKLKFVSELILQPQSEVPQLRLFLRQQGMCIVRETMIYEEGKYYPMFRVLPAEEVLRQQIEVEDGYVRQTDSGVKVPHADRLYLHFGKLLLEQKDETLQQFLLWKQRVNETIINQLKDKENQQGRREEIERELQLIKAAFQYMQDEH
jgi:tRNA (adenine22-N1)-methyltransferase